MEKRRKLHPYRRKKFSLNTRLALISLSVLVPMILLIGNLIYVLNSSNHAFDQITESVTYANSYAVEFSERMDYSMYLAVIRGQRVNELKAGTVTVNGVRIVNPYDYINELRAACDVMSGIATVKSNRNLPIRIKKTLNSLEKRVREIDENIDVSGTYNANLKMLSANIYSLTAIIESGIQEYINTENANLAFVKEEVMVQSRRAERISLVLVIAVIGLTTTLSVLASKSVTKPIQALCEMSRQVAKGDFTARTDIEAQDEIAVLTDSFNDMTEEIGNLVEGIKAEQENLRITESKLLQAQINPHFFYNTMDTIVWLAEEKRTEEVVSMITWLSEFFRTTLSKGKDFITVEEEYHHIQSYLKIQQFRYQDIMDYRIEFEPDILSCMIPKLMLQPLVENALYHGIKMKRGKGLIVITGVSAGEKLLFKVADNGKGLDEKALEELRRHVAGLENAVEGGFGVSNVNHRIQHYYGEEYGVFFESAEGEGTEATVILKKQV